MRSLALGACLLVLLFGDPGEAVAQSENLAPLIWAWGNNNHRVLGVGVSDSCPGQQCSKTPLQLTEPASVVAVAAGRGSHTLAASADGRVWAWGSNSMGQLGDAVPIGSDRVPPVVVGPFQDVVAVAGGENYSLALKSDGTVWSWGINNAGQLGRHTGTCKPTTTDRYLDNIHQGQKVFMDRISEALIPHSIPQNKKGESGDGR